MFTFKQVLSYLAISDSTLYRLMHQGKIRAYRVGSQWRFKRDEIDAYVQANASYAIA